MITTCFFSMPTFCLSDDNGVALPNLTYDMAIGGPL